MKAFKTLPLLMLLAGCSDAEEAAAADDCSNALTTMEINTCAAAQQEQTEAQLNAVYQQLMERLAEPDGLDDPASVQQQVRTAQRLWIDFRKADCDAQFALYAGGSIRTAVYLGCMQTRAAQRITELESYFPY